MDVNLGRFLLLDKKESYLKFRSLIYLLDPVFDFGQHLFKIKKADLRQLFYY